MRNYIKLFSLVVTLLMTFCVSAQAQTLLDGKKWTMISFNTNKPSGGFMSGGMQGAAIYNGKMYQFRTTTASVNYDIYDISAGTWTTGGALTCIANAHAGSGCFGTKVFTVSDGYTYNCTMPFVYLTNHENILIVDIENNNLVATWTLPKLDDDAITAYDFVNGKLWSIGYVSGSRKAPYIVREKTGLDFTTLPTNQTFTFTDDEKISLGGPDNDGVQRTLVNGTIQDCQYVDGKIYFCAGGGSSAHRTEFCRIHVYDTSSKSIVETKMCTETSEAEGFVYDSSSNIFMMTINGSNFWKLSEGTDFDTQYNFQPATLNGEYYEISTPGQLLWFKQQVYGGRTAIKAKLTADINMSGVIDPFSCYVYDYTIALKGEETPFYPATFAFRGEFDGQSHTIDSYSITKTPYYYCGLFPYCINANIHDITVNGSITLSTCDAMVQQADGSWKAVSNPKQPVANVGLIGYMDGGTVSNVDVREFLINTGSVGTNYDSNTVHNLIGGSANNPTKTGCLESAGSHGDDGSHVYNADGFCIASGTCDAKYQEPTLVDGVYQIANAGNLWWLANYVNTNISANVEPGDELKAKAVLTADINMKGSKYGSFPGIGYRRTWNNGTKDVVVGQFTGSFDGQGYTISNFYISASTSYKALFNLTSTGATMKNFTINGDITVSAASQYGAVIGRVEGKTTLEDIHSAVNFTATGTVSAIGGIIGQAAGETSLNRCRYSGTITGNASYNGLGGIIGNAEGILTFNNCLFDGSISTTSTATRSGVDNGLKIGGICGRNNNVTKITNSMSRGTISVPEAADKGNVGVIMGTQTQDKTFNITNTYYTTITGLNAVGNNSSSNKAAANPTAITNETPLSLRVALGQENWKFVDPITDYPVPGIGGPILQVVTITFDTRGGSAITPISGVEGTPVTAPADPTKEGHDFAGWVDAQGNATLVPSVMPSQDLTIYASWKINQYTISFDTNGGTPATIDPIKQDYGTSITAPADPTREDWEFNGWSPSLPNTMPGYDLTVVAQWVREEYNNGFNTNTSCAANVKYQRPKGSGTAEDPYIIDNGGKLWWFATQVGTDKTLCAKLTAETINTECSTRGNMPQMGEWGAPYKGTFDGQGNTISDWEQTWAASRSGMFGYTENATIKDFTLEGTMYVSGANQQLGPIVGYTGAGTLVEDIHSKVNITANNTTWAIGGVVGRQNGTVNRCRYSGTITCATGVFNGIGGIVGETYGGTTNNCLFDGTIIAPSSDVNLRVGGIEGYQSESTASTVKNCFVNGTITVANYTTATSGIVFGGLNATNVRINASNIYYTNNNVSANLDRTAGISSRAAMGHCENVTGDACLADGTLVDLLGNGNWTQDSELGYPVPHKGTATEGFDANGFSYAKDGTHDAVTKNGEWYEIANGGQLLDYAQKIAAGTIAGTSKARLIKDVDLEWCEFPGIGVYSGGDKKYQGTFDGQGYTVRGMYRNILGGAQGQGMFNHAENAVIKNLKVEGEIQVHEGSSSTYFIGGVVGLGSANVTLEDVTSSVDINVIKGSAETRIIGGVVGRLAGTINRCRYNGTMDLGTIVGQQIGGVMASANGTTMSNCLYDGTILAATSNTTDTKVVIGGLLGIDNNKVTISNCLSNGTITLTDASAPITKVGAVWGQISRTDGTSAVTYYTTANVTKVGAVIDQAGGANASSNMSTTAVGTTSWADVTLALNNNSTATGNWQIDGGQVYPIPYYFSHEHTYNQYGYCSIEGCGKAEPIGEPILDSEDGKSYYHIDHLADLVTFRRMVAAATKGTEFNAKVTTDIDVTDLQLEWTDLIGDHDHPYCGTFDGQGHSFKGLNATSDKRYVGVFECVGIKDKDATKAKAGIVKNFSVSGKLTATYFSNWDSNAPLCMGVIGEIYNGEVENVHSSVEFVCTSGTRAHIGGVVGGSLHSSDDAGTIVIKNCSYTGTMNINASDCIGGIVGYAQHKTWISNTLFAGSINQTYSRNDNEQDGGAAFAQGKVSTYMGGVLGYCDSNSNGVQNSIIVGDMSSNLTMLDGVPTDPKKQMAKGTLTEGKNNMNICVGYDGKIFETTETESSAPNYYGNYITQEMKDKGYHQLPTTKFEGTAKIHPSTDFISGLVCARINAESTDGNKNPWGQILGYQVGYVDKDGKLVSRDGRYDPESPAQKYPIPGYTNPERKTYNVVKDADNNYTADYYFFDDYGDTTPLPSDAASMHVKHIEYTRKANYMGGYCSFILPFDFTEDMKPNDEVKFYQYASCDDKALVVKFKEMTDLPTAGTPFILYNPGTANDWVRTLENVDIAIKEGNPTDMNTAEGTTALNNGDDLEEGLYGTFNTIYINSGYWKIKGDGTELVYTNDKSHCYPFRCFLKLPYVHGSSSAAPRYTPVFEDAPEAIDQIVEDADNMGDTPCYNLQGQMVDDLSRPGIYIVGGKTIMVK